LSSKEGTRPSILHFSFLSVQGDASRYPLANVQTNKSFFPSGSAHLVYTSEKEQERKMSKKKRPKQTAQQKPPQWQPIGMLPTIATHIDGTLV